MTVRSVNRPDFELVGGYPVPQGVPIHMHMWSLHNTARWYTVPCCTVLYCTVLYCTVLYCTVLYCTVLNWTAVECVIYDFQSLFRFLVEIYSVFLFHSYPTALLPSFLSLLLPFPYISSLFRAWDKPREFNPDRWIEEVRHCLACTVGSWRGSHRADTKALISSRLSTLLTCPIF